MNLFNRNNKTQQQPAKQQPASKSVPVIITYPHRLDNDGRPIVRLRFVRSTVEPDHRYLSLLAWSLRIRTELLIMHNQATRELLDNPVFNPFKRDKDGNSSI